MMDDLDRRIAAAIAGMTTPSGAGTLAAEVMARTRTRPRPAQFLIVPVIAVVVLGVAAIGVSGWMSPGVERPAAGAPASAPVSPAVLATAFTAADVAPCGLQLRLTDVETVVRLTRASNFGVSFPAYKDRIPTEAATSAPAYVVVLKDRYPVEALRRAAPPAGETWPPQPTLAPGFRDVCLVIPGGYDGADATGDGPFVAILTDIDIAGLKP